MGLKVTIRGFQPGLAEIRGARLRFPTVLREELKRFGDEQVASLQAQIRANAFGLSKSGDGVPLIDSEKYVNGYLAVVQGRTVSMYSQGENDNMSNADLANLLEYGWPGHAPMPHLRPFERQVLGQLQTLGDRIMKRLFPGRV